MSIVIEKFNSNYKNPVVPFKYLVRFIPLLGFKDEVGENPYISLLSNLYKVKSVENPTIKFKPLEFYTRRGNVLYLPTVFENDKEIQLVFIDDESLSFFKFFIWQFSLISAARIGKSYDSNFKVFHFNYIDKSIDSVKGKFLFNVYLYIGDIKSEDGVNIYFESFYYRVFEQCFFLSLNNQSLDYSTNNSVLEYNSSIYFTETYYVVNKEIINF